jgi:hypothetical protein
LARAKCDNIENILLEPVAHHRASGIGHPRNTTFIKRARTIWVVFAAKLLKKLALYLLT